MKTTPWFNALVFKPARVGVYEIGIGARLYYSKWNGNHWIGQHAHPAEAEALTPWMFACMPHRWRGITTAEHKKQLRLEWRKCIERYPAPPRTVLGYDPETHHNHLLWWDRKGGSWYIGSQFGVRLTGKMLERMLWRIEIKVEGKEVSLPGTVTPAKALSLSAWANGLKGSPTGRIIESEPQYQRLPPTKAPSTASEIKAALTGLADPKVPTHYVHRNAGDAVFVKEAEFFKSQGGLAEDWGKAWVPVVSHSIEHARAVAELLLPKRHA